MMNRITYEMAACVRSFVLIMMLIICHIICILSCVIFLGEFTDCLLPAKKLMGTKNHDFMDSKRDAFEQYLQVSGKIENMSTVVNKRDTDQQCSYCTALL